jgi:hypothetical protein
MRIWFVDQTAGTGASLQATLQERTSQGWTIFSVLTNGINAWTVVCWKDA